MPRGPGRRGTWCCARTAGGCSPSSPGSGCSAFIVYATWAAFRNGNYFVGLDHGRNYLSPLYSPCLAANCPAAVRWGPITPANWTITPAFLILIFPLGFRLTCYYYRKTYYRSFWLSPPACAVADAGSTKPGGLRSRYTGETRFPLILQNVHRYFWYFTLIFAGLLTWDAIEAFRFPGGVGMGLGTLIFVVNAVLHLGLHARLPRLPPPLRRRPEAVLEVAGSALVLDEPHDAAERAPPAVRLAVAGLDRGDATSTSASWPSGAFNDPRIF